MLLTTQTSRSPECKPLEVYDVNPNNTENTMPSDTSNHLYEIDFLISTGDKISLIEVKSGNYREHKSQDVFCDKYSSRIRDKYVVHTKDYKWENGIYYLPVYMVPFL